MGIHRCTNHPSLPPILHPSIQPPPSTPSPNKACHAAGPALRCSHTRRDQQSTEASGGNGTTETTGRNLIRAPFHPRTLGQSSGKKRGFLPRARLGRDSGGCLERPRRGQSERNKVLQVRVVMERWGGGSHSLALLRFSTISHLTHTQLIK